MGQALYRKYRSKSLNEVVGQEHIITTLKNALQAGTISHAYLFTGPKGVGKTSIARILAHEVNDLKYDEAAPHLDIIEIDAASNRRIDEIRELRERVQTAPTSAKYKVYIIDEVHMLTKEAFNALLKTLEEPPAHVIFILATTEAHKLPETIISRTQRFNFKPIEDGAVVKHLQTIAKKEGITVSDEALQLVAKYGEGSMRDSVSLLDQLSNSAKSIDKVTVEQVLGIVPEEHLKEMILALERADTSKVLDLLNRLEESSSAAQIAKQLNQSLRLQVITQTSQLTSRQLTTLMRELVTVPASHDPSAALQIALLDVTLQDTPIRANSPASATISPASPQPISAHAPRSKDEQPGEVKKTANPPATATGNLWDQVLAEVKEHHATLYAITRMAKATIEANRLQLELQFPFHRKQLTEAKNMAILSDILLKLTNKEFTIECVVVKTAKADPAARPGDQFKTISNIFNGAEMLES